jgi:E1A-binding protein p400
MEGILREFLFAIPKARAPPVEAWCCKPDGSALRRAAAAAALAQREWFERAGPLRTAVVRKQMFFPDRRLLQYDCGKLVELDVLLRRLKTGGHRVLIFTQVRWCVDIWFVLCVWGGGGGGGGVASV